MFRTTGKIILVLAGLLGPAASPATAGDVTALLPGIVKISTTIDGSPTTGTGFLVAVEENGTAAVVTAAHVVAGGSEVRLTFYPDPATPRRPTATRMDEGSDVAVLWVAGVPAGVSPLTVSAERSPQPGEAVQMIGFPRRAADPRVIAATISGFEGSLLVVSPGAEEGNSGGPLLRGAEVVGMVTETEDRRFAHAVPAMILRLLLAQWRVPLAGPPPAPPPPSPARERYPCHGSIIFQAGAAQPLYATPSTTGWPSTKIPEEATVEILVQRTVKNREWYQVRYQGTEGWVPRESVRLSGDCPR